MRRPPGGRSSAADDRRSPPARSSRVRTAARPDSTIRSIWWNSSRPTPIDDGLTTHAPREVAAATAPPLPIIIVPLRRSPPTPMACARRSAGKAAMTRAGRPARASPHRTPGRCGPARASRRRGRCRTTRRDREDRDPGDEGPAPADEVGQPAAEDERRGEDDVVRVEDPRQLGDRRPREGLADRREGDVDDRRVEEGEEGAEARDEEDARGRYPRRRAPAMSVLLGLAPRPNVACGAGEGESRGGVRKRVAAGQAGGGAERLPFAQCTTTTTRSRARRRAGSPSRAGAHGSRPAPCCPRRRGRRRARRPPRGRRSPGRRGAP